MSSVIEDPTVLEKSVWLPCHPKHTMNDLIANSLDSRVKSRPIQWTMKMQSTMIHIHQHVPPELR